MLEEIYERVPVGIPRSAGGMEGSHESAQGSETLLEWVDGPLPGSMDRGRRMSIAARADLQLGTLGSGNHFIELQADGDDGAWLMLHTGSRRFGF